MATINLNLKHCIVGVRLTCKNGESLMEVLLLTCEECYLCICIQIKVSSYPLYSFRNKLCVFGWGGGVKIGTYFPKYQCIINVNKYLRLLFCNRTILNDYNDVNFIVCYREPLEWRNRNSEPGRRQADPAENRSFRRS